MIEVAVLILPKLIHKTISISYPPLTTLLGFTSIFGYFTASDLTTEINDFTSVKGLKVVSVSAHSIMKKLHNFQPLIRAADICCFTESWLSNDITASHFQIDGFLSARQDRSPHIKKTEVVRPMQIVMKINPQEGDTVRGHDCTPIYNVHLMLC